MPDFDPDDIWAARAMAIVNCHLCDDEGYRGTVVCDHVDYAAIAERNRPKVQAVLDAIRRRGHQRADSDSCPLIGPQSDERPESLPTYTPRPRKRPEMTTAADYLSRAQDELKGGDCDSECNGFRSRP